ncbi:MAG: hypothetical protein JO076_13970 [Verrucomicrobia bacterium]|nr:hypothetical protein [Verrucomicrobiota bacterium]
MKFPTPPILPSTDDLHQVEQWLGHINRHLDGIVAKRADAPYRPGDKQTNLKLKNITVSIVSLEDIVTTR